MTQNMFLHLLSAMLVKCKEPAFMTGNFYGHPIGLAIILCSCGYYLFLSLPILSGRRVDVCHTSTHGLSVNLKCRSEMCCMWVAENTRCRNYTKIRHLCSMHDFVGL